MKAVETLQQLADFLNENLEHSNFLHIICKKNDWIVSREIDRTCYDPKNNLEIVCTDCKYNVFETKDTIDSIDDVKRMVEMYMRPYQGNEIPSLALGTDGKLRYFERWWHKLPVFECDASEVFSMKKSDFNMFISNKIVRK